MPRKQDHQEKLATLIQELAEAEAEQTKANEAYAVKKAELDALLEPLKTVKDEKAAKVEDLRLQVKAEGLKVEKQDLHPALALKEHTDIQFDDAEMFQWCILFNPSLLELNRSNITQHVNWILGLKSQTRRYFGADGKKPLVPMPVTVEKVPTIEIKSDLTKWLPVPSEPESVTHFPGGTKEDLDKWVNEQLGLKTEESVPVEVETPAPPIPEIREVKVEAEPTREAPAAVEADWKEKAQESASNTEA